MHRLLIGASALALILSACDSGGGPLHRPDVSADRILGAAVPALLPRAVPNPDNGVQVVDHLDPSLASRSDLPELIGQQIASGNADQITARLSDGIRDAIVDALGGRPVLFVEIEGTPAAPDDPRCASGDTGASVRLAVVPAMAVHGDVYLVVSETGDLCGGWFWAAARMLWQAGGIAGGDWVIGELIGGGVTN